MSHASIHQSAIDQTAHVTPQPKPKTTSNLQQANSDATAAQIAYFRAIPWCAAHLSPAEATEAPLIVDQSLSRVLNPAHDDSHSLISRTLNTPAGIPAYIAFHPPPPAAGALVREVKALAALGPGVNGWPGICHGGIITVLLDEAVARVAEVNQRLGLMRKDVMVVTGQLNLKFLKPVRTGSVEKPRAVLVTARLAKAEGRRYWVEADVSGPDGEVLVKGDGVMVALKAAL